MWRHCKACVRRALTHPVESQKWLARRTTPLSNRRPSVTIDIAPVGIELMFLFAGLLSEKFPREVSEAKQQGDGHQYTDGQLQKARNEKYRWVASQLP